MTNRLFLVCWVGFLAFLYMNATAFIWFMGTITHKPEISLIHPVAGLVVLTAAFLCMPNDTSRSHQGT